MNNPPSESKISTESSGGSFITTISSKRTMQTYLIVKTELDRIRSINTRAIMYGSLSAGFFTYGGDILLDYWGEANLTPKQEILLDVVSWAFLIVAAVFGFLAYREYKSKNTLFDQIDQETSPVEGGKNDTDKS